MLVLAMEFSRYGRSRLSVPLRALQPVLTEGAQRPFPQDPTACSACAPLRRSFRAAARPY